MENFNANSKTNNNFTFGSFINSYLNEASVDCFERCINDFSKADFNNEEKNCVDSCYAKYFLSYANMATLLDLNYSKK
jgi:hypothetical protein